MCFTPFISLSTAIIEFVLATILLVFFRKSILRNFFAVFIYLLGFYQLSEFMLCSSGNAIVWAIVGFVTYSFFPAIGLHAVLKIFKKKFSIPLLYLVPAIATFAAISIPNFIIRAECERFFISVGTIMTQAASFFQLIPFIIYISYYFGFSVLACFIIYQDYVKQKDIIKRKIELIEIMGIIFMIIPTLVLIILFPVFNVMFPSVLCEFAIFVAICAFIGACLESKLNKKVRR